jgi:hypothetical protein
MNIPIYPGSSSFFPGNTPFGFYDNDYEFQIDADRVASFCARRLGFPIVDIELQDINFYAAFEEAITTYGNTVYSWKLKENYISIEGTSTGSFLNDMLITPNMGSIIRISEQYGTEAGVGGLVNYYTGSIMLLPGQQVYDLNAWASSSGIADGDLEIRRVFYEAPPAIVRYFDPWAGTGNDIQGLLDAFGFGNYSPGISFMLMPIYFDIEKIQAIEFNDQVRKSNYSFELINNKLRIFPIPNRIHSLSFTYLLKSERNNPFNPNINGVTTNVSNAPYKNPTYSKINSIGRQWIFEYTLVLCKEMLGYVRGKYTQLPIPGREITLNQSDLLTSAANEKTLLIEKLKLDLLDSSRTKQLENKANESDFRLKEMNNVPLVIYIG